MRKERNKAGKITSTIPPAKDKKDFEDNKEPVENQVRSWILRLLIRINDSGILALLPGSTVKIYLALLRHRFKDRPGFALGAKRVMGEAGIKQEHTYYNALNQLEAVGLMSPRKRGPKNFHYVNIYDIPLDPNINIMNLKAELNRQKKQRTLMSKKGISVNEKSQKSTKTRKGLPHITEQRNDTTLMSKKGVSVNEKALKKTPMSKNDRATLMSKNDRATLMSKNDTHKEVKKVNKVNIKDKAKKILIESENRKNQKSKNQKLDTSEKAFAKQMDSFIKKEKTDKKKLKKVDQQSIKNPGSF